MQRMNIKPVDDGFRDAAHREVVDQDLGVVTCARTPHDMSIACRPRSLSMWESACHLSRHDTAFLGMNCVVTYQALDKLHDKLIKQLSHATHQVPRSR